MTATDAEPCFDVEALRKLAGDKAFARGQIHHRDGQVELLAVEPHRVVARVTGSEDYRAELTGRGKDIDGDCSCLAFEDLGFCKHLVAAALAANEAAESGGAVGALDRIRRHLASKEADALVDMILKLAERDSTLFRELDTAAAVASDDDSALRKRLRKAIDHATYAEYYVDYRAADDWAANVGKALDSLATLLAEGRAALALGLVEHALSRIAEAVESIDDSDGHIGMLLERAADIHLEACRAARPDPIALARDIFKREIEDDGDTFSRAVTRYADVLGDDGLAEYRRLAVKAWNKLPPVAGKPRATDDYSPDYWTLQSILDFFAERDGDVEARIAIRAKYLTSPSAYLELAQFLHAQGRQVEALHRAEEGLWLFEDSRPDERLVGFTVDLLANAGRLADAEALLWRAFERQPSMELYEQLRRHAGEPARDRAIALLQAQVAKAPAATRWDSPADLLVRVFMQEKMHTEAWDALHKHGASRWLEEELAKNSEHSHQREALAVYSKRVDELVCGGTGYQEASRIVAHMAGLWEASEHDAYVAGLKIKFKLKRNFMKLLNAM